MDSQQFDRLARALGSRRSRRQALTVLGGAAVAAAIPAVRAEATILCEITCPSSSWGYAYGDTCTAAAEFGVPTNNGACGDPVNITCVPAPGELLTIGSHTVECTVDGLPANCSFPFEVYDVSNYVLTCPANISQEAEVPTSVPFGDAILGTECGANYGPNYICDHTTGDVFPLGTTTVNCSAILPSGKQGEIPECSFTITLAPAPATATPTEVPPTVAPTTVPGDPTATSVPTAVDPTSIPPDPTATTAAVTELPNTGAGDNGSGTAGKLIPVAAVGAGAALLARLGLRRTSTEQAD